MLGKREEEPVALLLFLYCSTRQHMFARKDNYLLIIFTAILVALCLLIPTVHGRKTETEEISKGVPSEQEELPAKILENR